ncbi:hypothetical protein HDE77_001279 [Rhodanobacter sp. MP7CTX1]|nr:hypothetical protein [Rhodanobacter sp. MP7CTX1]
MQKMNPNARPGRASREQQIVPINVGNHDEVY